MLMCYAISAVQREIDWNTILTVIAIIFASGAGWSSLKNRNRLNSKENQVNGETIKAVQEELEKFKEHCNLCQRNLDERFASKDEVAKVIEKQEALFLCFHDIKVNVAEIKTANQFILDELKQIRK